MGDGRRDGVREGEGREGRKGEREGREREGKRDWLRESHIMYN